MKRACRGTPSDVRRRKSVSVSPNTSSMPCYLECVLGAHSREMHDERIERAGMWGGASVLRGGRPAVGGKRAVDARLYRREGLGESSLHAWRRRFRSEDAAAKSEAKPSAMLRKFRFPKGIGGGRSKGLRFPKAENPRPSSSSRSKSSATTCLAAARPLPRRQGHRGSSSSGHRRGA